MFSKYLSWEKEFSVIFPSFSWISHKVCFPIASIKPIFRGNCVHKSYFTVKKLYFLKTFFSVFFFASSSRLTQLFTFVWHLIFLVVGTTVHFCLPTAGLFKLLVNNFCRVKHHLSCLAFLCSVPEVLLQSFVLFLGTCFSSLNRNFFEKGIFVITNVSSFFPLLFYQCILIQRNWTWFL